MFWRDTRLQPKLFQFFRDQQKGDRGGCHDHWDTSHGSRRSGRLHWDPARSPRSAHRLGWAHVWGLSPPLLQELVREPVNLSLFFIFYIHVLFNNLLYLLIFILMNYKQLSSRWMRATYKCALGMLSPSSLRSTMRLFGFSCSPRFTL